MQDAITELPAYKAKTYAEWKAERWERHGAPVTRQERERWEAARLEALAPLSDPPENSEFWQAAREAFLASLPPPPKLGTPEGDKPDWILVHERAMHPPNLPRVIAGMDFDRITPEVPRGGCPGFEPTYLRTGYAFLDRDTAAQMNRASMYRPCRLLLRGTPSTLSVWLDMIEGCWRDTRGGALGEDIITLGAYAWRCSFGRAAHRISRLTGHGELPRVGDLARR
jgi:hypothetical protein